MLSVMLSVNFNIYGIYSEYLLGTIVPLLGSPVPIAHFAPLNETNQIHPTPPLSGEPTLATSES